ncbi:MAG: hypothetical protein VYE68_13080 [Acidobacteriota bacterium]|nr:hypothetical protein [Acidobacteriota bacterium]
MIHPIGDEFVLHLPNGNTSPVRVILVVSNGDVVASTEALSGGISFGWDEQRLRNSRKSGYGGSAGRLDKPRVRQSVAP